MRRMARESESVVFISERSVRRREGFFCVRRMARGKEREGGDNNEQVVTFN